MIRLNDIEVGENDRPIEPPKIFKTEVCKNKFINSKPLPYLFVYLVEVYKISFKF